jgi:large subunit ribosomal protein L13
MNVTKTTRPIQKKEQVRNWYVIDAKGARLGKLATQTASLLIGKHKVTRTNTFDNGDSVIIINAGQVDVFYKKLTQKKYYRHSGYMGSTKVETLGHVLEVKPQLAIRKAVWGMLPQNRMGKKLLSNLFIYNSADHKHEAQQPKLIVIK